MNKDSSEHHYLEVENVRLTFIPASDREQAKNWSGKDVIRIQAYQGSDRGKSLHMGAEFPVSDWEALARLVAGICRLYAEQKTFKG